MIEIVEKSFEKLEEYCKKENFKGWDPYDGLNSRLFEVIPFISKSQIVRLIWIQTFKRSPINFRKIAEIKKDYNPKDLGLFLSSYCNMYSKNPNPAYLDQIQFFSQKLIELQNTQWSGSCWGYNFDWQARAFFQPKNTPTVVATVFNASALLDAYEITQDE